MTKQLAQLVSGFTDTTVPDISVSGLCLDSRQLQPGDVFVAIPGTTADGRRFISRAIEHGAVAVLTQELVENSAQFAVPIIQIAELTQHVGEIAARFYDQPCEKLTVIGVTGTNGKTSITHYIAHALAHLGYNSAVIGTLGSGPLSAIESGRLTTPDAITVQKTLAGFVAQGITHVAMEVSSHALDQHRVAGVQFHSAIFTNLTRDHLDYHGDMDSYFAAKAKLFIWPGLKNAIINLDDEYGQKLWEISGAHAKVGYSLSETLPPQAGGWGVKLLTGSNIKQTAKGISATINSPWGSAPLQINTFGRFNLSNCMATLATLCGLEIPFDRAIQALATLPTVPGRMQPFGGNKQPLVVVDYSHTPDALQQALTALREHASGKLWCVFGCGGGRDSGKRRLMGEVAERYSDQIIITNDNPRDEEPQAIADDIVQGLVCPWAVEIELDRGAAIAHAIDCAQGGDVVLIAGKGHEDYQEICGERIPFNDIEHVKQQVLRKKTS